VCADKLVDFMAAQSSCPFYPEDFGVIIESGEGEPTPEVRQKMAREYGFNHDQMADIPSPESERNSERAPGFTRNRAAD